MKWIIEFEDVPKSKNALQAGRSTGWVWKKRNEEFIKWRQIFWALRIEQGIPPATTPRSIGVTMYFPRPARRDVHNFINHAFIDALVAGGWLVDDSPRWLTGIEGACIYDKDRGPLTVVKIEES